EHVAAEAQRFFSRQTVLANAAHEIRRHDDAVPRFEGSKQPRLFNLSGDFTARDVRQRDGVRKPSATRKQVEMIDAAGADANQHLVGPDLRGGDLFVLENLRTAKPLED